MRRPAETNDSDPAVASERRRALVALLQHPVLAADGDLRVEFGLVRRHQDHLRTWLDRHPGWRLRVSADVARLYKSPADLADATRPACDAISDMPFTRRRYAMLCLALAVLERADRQTTLGNLAKDVEAAAANDAVLAGACRMDFTQHDHRRDLVHVVRWLLQARALVRVHGDERQYLDAKGDALYDVRRAVLSHLPAMVRGPSTVDATDLEERMAAITNVPTLDTDDARNRRLRSSLTRRLLDDPVVYYADLDEEERAYLASQRPHLVGHIEEATGLRAEIRAEGIAMVDESGELTDIGLPEEGTEGHLTLLVAEHLADRLRQAEGEVRVGLEALRAHVVKLVQANRAHWRKDATVPGAEGSLTEMVIDRLHALGLVRRAFGAVIPRPAIARYALAEISVDGEREKSA